jgi:hypothetical protein
MGRAQVRITSAAVIALAAVSLSLASYAPPVAAHWAGFTGEWWWCKPFESASDSPNSSYYVLEAGGNSCVTSPIHSYGFSSGTDVTVGSAGDQWVCVDIRTPDLSGTYTGARCPYPPARVCVDGIYPNCHDSDGYSARGMTWMPGGPFEYYNKRIKGHAVY